MMKMDRADELLAALSQVSQDNAIISCLLLLTMRSYIAVTGRGREAEEDKDLTPKELAEKHRNQEMSED